MLEDCLKEVRTAIEDDLPALLDAEDAEYAAADVIEFGAAIVLDDIVTIRFEEYEEFQIQEYPAVFLLARGGTEDSPWMTAETRLRHTVECHIVITDTSPTILFRRLMRSAEAFRRMLSANIEGTGVASDPVFQTDIQRVDYSPTFELEAGGLARSVVVSVALDEVEDRP